MEHFFGYSEYQYRKNNKTDVVINTKELINGHLLLTGMSGTGKSHQAKRLIGSALKQGVVVDIMDVHNELDLPGTDQALYSEASRLGFNLLTINPDPHSGGVRKRINEIINMINATGRQLGTKQETALRNLINDVYFLNGVYEDRPASWKKKEITEAIRRDLISNRNYKGLKVYYPTIDDLMSYAERKLNGLYIGSNIQAVTALEHVNRCASQINSLTNRYNRDKSDPDKIKKLEDHMEKAKERSKLAYEDYISKIETGRELADIMKYNSKDVLQSVLERLQNLNAAGIFRPNPPEFKGIGRCHQIKHLSDEEQKMFVYMRLESIFRESRDKGVQNDVTNIVVLDEAHKFIVDDSSNIINVIAKEGRKFGLALWCASQSPTHFSEDFQTNCGTTILLGLHSSYWDTACRKLKIDSNVLKYIKPHQTAAIRLQKKGSMEANFVNTIINESALSE